ncbi:hypothetical protein EKO27_g10952 [Xylaria grammica]|uniref:Uncharacterized protein n=1 Tax=Xylaria grammica TaxID=363999 RepID=A0A439CPR3_9PEZI|nr:hypothetical protein EKO27_g10952 [Xylaria grammica]
MFALPEAKRVRRKDLYDSASASGSALSDEEGDHDSRAKSALHAKLNAQLSGLFNLSFVVGPGAQPQPQATGPTGDAQHEGEHPEEEVFAFRLFRDEAPTHTVVLTHDEDLRALGDGGFVVPSRPRSYYVASAPSERQASEYRSAAVTAEYVLSDAKKRRWGLEKPWRVIHILPSADSASSKSAPKPAGEGSAGEEKKRTRPGKKHRVLLRVREKAKREREEAAKKLLADKEHHLQEKKKRLNRERKLKRRQKEREKKAGLQTADPDGGGDDDDSQKDVDEES